MTDVKGLTKIGVHHKLFPQGDIFAYVNEYGMLINVVETPCGFDAYMDIENKYDNRFDMFEVTEDNCKSFIHFNTMDEVADYSNKLIYKCRIYGISSYDHSHIHSVADLCNPTFQDVSPYKTEFTTERMICHDIAPFKADCQTFKELFAHDGITLHLEINSANYAPFIGRNEQLFAVVETGHFAYVITKLSKVGYNYGADNLDCIEDDIALSEVRNDPSFEMISENYYWLSYKFKFRGHTYAYGQYLDREYQRAITCVDTKKMAFIFTDDESEAFADSKGYDIHGWGDNVPDDETWARESGEYIRSKIIGVLESIANPLAYFTQIGDYGDDEIRSMYLFDDYSEFINNLVSIKSGGKFTNKLDTYTFVSEDANGVCTYDVLTVYPRDDYSRQYQVKLQLIKE
jgi:hypothetical protein